MAEDPYARSNRAILTARALRVLAALAPDRRTPDLDRSGEGPTSLAWLGTIPLSSQMGSLPPVQPGSATPVGVAVDRTPELEALARHDALTPGVDELQLGWLWIVGRAEVAGADRRIVMPLLSLPARITRSILRWSVAPMGPWDLWPLVADEVQAQELEERRAFGGGALDPTATQALIDRLPQLRRWVDDVVAASGLPPISRLLAPTDPRTLDPGNGLVAVTGAAVFVGGGTVDLTRPRDTLTAWSQDPGAVDTSFASMYLGPPATPPWARGPGDLPPPPRPVAALAADLPPTLPLADRQAEVVLRARHAAVTVVSGPPGTGKSQTAAAVALDCVARGESVLLATRSVVAADVLASLLDRLPGPDPVLFGGSVLARKLAAQLADGVAAPRDTGAAVRYEQAAHVHAELAATTQARLADVIEAEAWKRQVLSLPRHALVAPRLLDPGATATVDEAVRLLDAARRPGGWFGDRRRRRSTDALCRHLGAAPGTSLDELASAIDLAAQRDRAARVHRWDPESAARAWEAYVAAEESLRRAAAAALAANVAARSDGAGRRAVAALAAALRAGRSTRRAHLARVDVRSLTGALPLWVGTLGEIETLLPPTAGAFDVLVLDEASQIDQVSASAALLRARRVVVVGDPRQLRFVSFVADRDVAAAIEAEQAHELTDRLDVRRVSAFDLAAGVAPVTFLDEHYRSVPHLIGFSASRFYEGRLHIATRNPANDDEIAIDVRRLDGARTDGVNEVEVAASLAEVESILAAGPHATVGVISPYRLQVEAIEARLGDALDLEVLQTGRVRVGTVHAFQGSEADVVVASFGIGGHADRGRRFLEDPNLFNVLVTRARRRLIVLSSGGEPRDGLLADYLGWSLRPPTPPPEDPSEDEWTQRLAAALRDAGCPVHSGYPVGIWTIDLVAGDGREAIAVATRVHPDGPERHRQRHLALARAGWQLAEAFPTDRDGDVVAAALALREQVLAGRLR